LEENGCRLWVWSRKAKTERFVSLVRQVFPGLKKLLEFVLFFAKSPNICLGQLQKSASYVVKNESCPLLKSFSRESPISKYSWTRTGRSGYAAGSDFSSLVSRVPWLWMEISAAVCATDF
jgi:hypothetical protein